MMLLLQLVAVPYKLSIFSLQLCDFLLKLLISEGGGLYILINDLLHLNNLFNNFFHLNRPFDIDWLDFDFSLHPPRCFKLLRESLYLFRELSYVSPTFRVQFLCLL